MATSIADAARIIVAERIGGARDGFRAFLETVDDVAAADSDAGRAALIEEEPPPTGDPRFDALAAALAEHLAITHGLRPPSWSSAPQRTLSTWWFPSELRSLHAAAIVEAPMAFARRGIFITDRALLRA